MVYVQKRPQLHGNFAAPARGQPEEEDLDGETALVAGMGSIFIVLPAYRAKKASTAR